MSASRSKRNYDTVWLIRRLFRVMASRADDYLHETGLSAADRAVMEFLYPAERLSVPEIARRYDVSRQHVQVTVNALLDRELLRNEPNPRHKRSSLLRLSDRGCKQFEAIRSGEAALIDDIFASIADDALDVTQQTLRELLQQLK